MENLCGSAPSFLTDIKLKQIQKEKKMYFLVFTNFLKILATKILKLLRRQRQRLRARDLFVWAKSKIMKNIALHESGAKIPKKFFVFENSKINTEKQPMLLFSKYSMRSLRALFSS